MAVTTFIPELWSARLLYALEKSHVATNLVNRNYEGVIAKQGDTVHINSIGAITVKDYTKNTDIAAPDALTTTTTTGAKTSTPPANNPAKNYTTAEIKNMSAAEINANWDSIKASLNQKGV